LREAGRERKSILERRRHPGGVRSDDLARSRAAALGRTAHPL